MKIAIVPQNESHSLRENKCNFQKTEFFNLRIFYLLNKIHNLKLIF
ncbi:hypothetical protein LEP1GSC083_0797 [Leptospira interrogans serovar Pyrogenes str. L0374]|uniref:Uncharacterized protein n=3 Tax=Leptospira interrogans TaxID=173 RepID=M6KN82_LEPIR|nr:hypothetical protein G436_1283 [Leptospira interrogans serovar Hardjo str. Norma]EKO05689.1 hypothetical protein LEP1GSC077_3499 [Leptospira interrogans str. C10069]EKO98960.1 hypothetical protein LEP1GSC057_0759 [Leptospira interrogans str. Brem 329]EKR18726.1 hypothetical protein LEP1GSC019_4216 [Leptospira interrogans serovar Pyrogenes str. 2006006960]EMF31633.1 hypothetical protein LEP1GSC201_3914 [Leptospira interrogans serovar Pomona str. Fox 32256]EMF44840.1 hypothetical protein LEP1